MAPHDGYYRHPTIHGDAVVFVCEDDLWRVDVNGGPARRLTAAAGRVTFPSFSPDGRWIAFTGQDEGPTEVYVMEAGGGGARRLTWLGGFTQVVGWRPNGAAVVFASDWRQHRINFAHLHAVPLAGGDPRPLDLGPARAIAHAPRGKGVVIGRNSGDPARWKRYRGGTAGTLWIDREGTGRFEELIRLPGNLASPLWIRDRVYFLSDHEGHGNLYSCTPRGRALRRHTHHEDFYVRFPSTDGKRIAYHAGSDLFVHDPGPDETRRIEVEIASPRMGRRRRFVEAASHLEEARLHPRGHSLAVVARGGAHTLGLWEGAAQRHGEASRERHRLASWLPDGKSLLTVSDRGGEEGLVVFPLAARGRPREVRADLGRVLEVAVAPAGSGHVALSNHRQEVLLVDLGRRRVRRVDASEHARIEGLAWSPDGRFLAYGLPDSQRTSCIRILEASTGRVRTVTDSSFWNVRPAFDPEGRYLYFVSARFFDPVYDALLFDLGFPRGARPCLLTLRKDVASPFDPAQRPPRAPQAGGGGPPPWPKEAPKGKEPPRVKIDFDGIQDRVVSFPVPDGRYLRVRGAKNRVLFSSEPVQGSLDVDWLPTGPPPAKVRLEAYDFRQEKTETVCDGITSFGLSADGETLLLRVGNRLRVVPATVKASDLSAKTEPGRETGWIDLGRLNVEVVPGEEWRQMCQEAWRLQRDQFWTPDMSRVDWEGVRRRYLPLVERVACRSEFSDLLWEMQGELGTSHCYEMGGDYRPVPPWHQGLLGADLEQDGRTGAWRIVRIPRGDPWDSKRASPLSAPGLDVRVGDEIVEVAGRAVGRACSPYECLVNRAEQPVTLTLRRRTGQRTARRTVTVRTLRQEYRLRYRDWVEENRRRVHEATKGRVGYVHIPDMGPLGYSEFHRYYVVEVHREGLLLDLRFNGGGHVSELLLQKLLRRRIAYGPSRWGRPISYPEDAPMGPMVALTNEYAGSDGDMFCHAFKLFGLGPLVGKRTWGGVVGIWPRHALVDGTWTSQPEFATWFQDVGWGVENYGTDPDIEVDITPQDHREGRDPQLDRAVKEVLGILRREKPRVPAFEKAPDLRPPRLRRER